MIMYKIRHKPTGLFFKPAKYPYKSNLSKNGKVYHTKPSLRYLGERYYHPIEKKSRWDTKNYEQRRVILENWEIIELKVEE